VPQESKKDPFAQFAVQETKPDPFAAYAVEESKDDPFAQFAVSPPEEEREWFQTKPVTQKELDSIAKKYKLTPEQIETLQSAAPAYGGYTEAQSKAASESMPQAVALGTRRVFGSTGQLLGGVPQKVVEKIYGALEGENFEAAMDDLDKLVQSKSSVAQRTAEIGGGMMVPGLGSSKAIQALRGAKGIAASVGIGAGSGAAAGFGMSRPGEELEEAAIGAGIGAALGGTLGVGGEFLRKRAKDGDKRRKVLQKSLDDAGIDSDIGTYIEEGMKKKQEEIEFDLDKIVSYAYDADRTADELIAKLSREERINLFKRSGKETPDETIGRVKEEILQKLNKRKDFRKLTKEEKSAQIEAALHRKARVEVVKDIRKKIQEVEEFTNKRIDDLITKSIDERGASKLGMEEKLGATPTYKHLHPELRKPLEILEKNKLADEWEANAYKVLATNKDTNRLVSYVSDMRPLLQSLDKRFKLSLTPQLDKLGKAANWKKEVVTDTNKLIKEYKKHKDADRLFDEIDTLVSKEKIGGGTPVKLKDYVNKIGIRKDFIDWAASVMNEAEKLGYRIDEKTQRWARPRDVAPELKDRLGVLQKELNHITQETSIVDALNKIQKGDRGEPASGWNVVGRYLDTKEKEIPSYARISPDEVERIALTYARDVAGKLTTREALASLTKQAEILSKFGDTVAAGRIEDMINDVRGIPKSTYKGKKAKPGALSREGSMIRQVGLARKMKALLDKKEAGTFTKADQKQLNRISMKLGMESLPMTMSNLFYGNALASPKSALKNYFSVLTNTLPFAVANLGAKESGLVLAATAKAFAKSIINRSDYLKKAKELGIFHEGFKKEHQDLIKSAIYKEAETNSGVAKALSGSGHLLEGWTKALLFMFTKGEEQARSWVVAMGEELGSAMAKNPQLRKQLADRAIDPHIGNRLAGDKSEKEMQDIMSVFLSNETMLNYDRAHMSAMGRHLGPMFSMFSKWPTTIGGQMIAAHQTKGLPGAGRYLTAAFGAPAALAAVIDSYARDEGMLERDHPYAKLVGPTMQWLPGEAPLAYMREGGPSNAPFVAILKSIAKISDGEDLERGMEKAMKKVGQSFIYGGPEKLIKLVDD
jgi:hypothetical protein